MARFEYAVRDAKVTAGAGAAPDALFELGLRYCAGRGVKIDLIAAHKWFSLAALRGSAPAKRYRGEIAIEMSRAEIMKAQRLAREWLAAA